MLRLLVGDCEQGWEFHAFAEGTRLFLRKGDFDSGEEYFVIATDRTLLASQVPIVADRLERLEQWQGDRLPAGMTCLYGLDALATLCAGAGS